MAKITDYIARGTYASLPAAGNTGALYYATDVGIIYRDNGASWDIFSTDINSGVAALTAPAIADKLLVYDADAGVLKAIVLSDLMKFISGLTEQASPADEDLVIIQEATGGAIKKVQAVNLPGGGGGGGLFDAYALIQDQKASGSYGGTFTAGSYQTRDLNTEVYDTGNIVSVSGNQLTIEAGTYRILARAPAVRVDAHKLRFYNISDSSVEIVGENAFTDDGDLIMSYAVLEGRFTIAAQKIFELQHYGTLTRADYGFGSRFNVAGNTEIYSSVLLMREAS